MKALRVRQGFTDQPELVIIHIDPFGRHSELDRTASLAKLRRTLASAGPFDRFVKLALFRCLLDWISLVPNRLAVLAIFAVMLPSGFGQLPDHPSAEISNELIRAKIYLPNQQSGFYRGTRFDWSGILHSLQANGHNYYGTWFDQTDPDVHDFIYKDGHIIAGPCSAITGPVDEFAPIAYDEAKPGDTFLKIGIGALTKPGGDKYDNYHLYEIENGGEWSVTKQADAIEFVQTLRNLSSGYGYRYQKSIRLTPGKAQLVLAHSLKNVGKRQIETTVYNHNFLVLDRMPPGPGVVITVPFAIRASRPGDNSIAEIHGNKIVYTRTLHDRDVFAVPLEGFGQEIHDNAIQIENSVVGAGVRWQTDRPLLKENLWSIRTVIAMEPFISISIAPGAEFTWTTVYDYYVVSPGFR